ncbi:MAG TPA: 2-oxoacid:acceptor oxidoreductase family protein [Thermodesulfovibrionales bacterium]|nr:2-oxoacid:acceptor oxidoreductase family protein [Thermodesulfovibrionales bacterium]
MKETKILVAGFGGQGILLLGRLIGYGGMLEGKEVTCFPSYGAEVRGGTANSTVILSDELIGSPIIRNPDTLIAMNDASLKRFQSKVKPNGLLIFDSSLIKTPELRSDVHVVGVPASEIAASIGEASSTQEGSSLSASQVRSANMVMLGALIAETGILKIESAIKALEKLTSARRKKSIEGNKEAIMRGNNYIADKKSKDI